MRLKKEGEGTSQVRSVPSSRRAVVEGALATAAFVRLSTTASAQPARRPRPPHPPEKNVRPMKFINLVKYRDLGKIASARTAHFAYADRLREQGKLAIGGPLLDDHGHRIGLLFIYEAASRDEALSFAREDPFTLANALRSSEIIEWRLRGVNRDLLVKANRSGDKSVGEDTQIRLFANCARYTADKLKLTAARPAHWEYDRKLKAVGKLALAGPFADNTGGLFVYNAASRAEAISHLTEDPFALKGVFARNELFEWLIEGVKPDLLVSDCSSESQESAALQQEHL